MPAQDALLAVRRPSELVKMKALLWFCEFQTVTKPAGSFVSGEESETCPFPLGSSNTLKGS